MKILASLISILMVSLSCQAYGVAQPDNLSSECQEFLEKIGSRYTFSWIDVPETPFSTEKISIFYYYESGSKLENPVLFFNGGPGFSSHSSVDLLGAAKVNFGNGTNLNIDFIFMDQRGTGCSSRFPVGSDPSTLAKLNWYGSAGIVNDSEEIRKTLIGDKKWKIFGQSFGGHVVHRYLKMYPDSVVKAYAHGYPEGQSDFDFKYARISSQSQILATYLKNYPNDERRLKAVNRLLADPTKCFVKKNLVSFCGYEVLEPLVEMLGFRDNWNNLHAWLLYLVPGQDVLLESIGEYLEKFEGPFSKYHNAANLDINYLLKINVALNFIGIIDTNNSTMDAGKCIEIYKKMELVFKIKAKDILLDECKAPVQFEYIDQLAPALKFRASESESNYIKLNDVKANLMQFKVPFFLYSGGLDSFVPTALFQSEVKLLGSLATYINFPNSGHDGFHKEKRVFLELSK